MTGLSFTVARAQFAVADLLDQGRPVGVGDGIDLQLRKPFRQAVHAQDPLLDRLIPGLQLDAPASTSCVSNAAASFSGASSLLAFASSTRSRNRRSRRDTTRFMVSS
jgi:hypothetical protein